MASHQGKREHPVESVWGDHDEVHGGAQRGTSKGDFSMRKTVSYYWRELVYRMDDESIRSWLVAFASAIGIVLGIRVLCQLLVLVMG